MGFVLWLPHYLAKPLGQLARFWQLRELLFSNYICSFIYLPSYILAVLYLIAIPSHIHIPLSLGAKFLISTHAVAEE